MSDAATTPAPSERAPDRLLLGRRAARAFALLAAVVAVALAWRLASAYQAGSAQFDGRQGLQARIDGHTEFLPAEAVRCANCHRVALGAGASLGPALTRAALLQAQARRGGPPSRFDAVSLCKLLRTGIDPAWVTVSKAMPRYTLSDADCEHLWTYLRLAGEGLS